MKKQTKKTATPAKSKDKARPTANAETVAPVRVRDIGKNCPPMVEGAMRAVRGLFQDAVDATHPLRSVEEETMRENLTGRAFRKAKEAAAAECRERALGFARASLLWGGREDLRDECREFSKKTEDFEAQAQTIEDFGTPPAWPVAEDQAKTAPAPTESERFRREAAEHRAAEKRLSRLAVALCPAMRPTEETVRRALIEAGWMPDPVEAEKFYREEYADDELLLNATLAVGQRMTKGLVEDLLNDPEAWKTVGEMAKQEGHAAEVATQRADAAETREAIHALRDTAHAATPPASPSNPATGADEDADAAKGKRDKVRTQKPRVRKGMLDLAAEFMDVSRRQVQRYLDGSSPVPGEYRGFGYAVLESKDALENWILGLGLGERAAEFIARLADLAAKVGLGAPAPKRRERPPRYTPFDPSNDPYDPQAPNPFEEAANNIDGPPGEDENENW